jgi:hypothetical protein
MTASAASLAASVKKLRPQTAHIRSGSYVTEMAGKPIAEPIFEKSYKAFSNRLGNGSAVKKVGKKSLQRVQSANLRTKRKFGASR